jgi:hypothetical protein
MEGNPLTVVLIVYDYRDYHRTIIGFHGTTAAEAERLVNGEAFNPSTKSYDWLGQGVYFWEYAPKQAWWWTKDHRKNARPAVVGAMIRLGNCLDLLDPANVRSLKGVHDDILPIWHSQKIPIPTNGQDKMGLDCAIMNWVYTQSDETATPIETCRGVFVPTNRAKRVWKRSWIYDEAHIQICVRNQQNILALWHVRPDGTYGKA